MMKKAFNGAIAAGHEVTAETATEIIKAGGNIFDAAKLPFSLILLEGLVKKIKIVKHLESKILAEHIKTLFVVHKRNLS